MTEPFKPDTGLYPKGAAAKKQSDIDADEKFERETKAFEKEFNKEEPEK